MPPFGTLHNHKHTYRAPLSLIHPSEHDTTKQEHRDPRSWVNYDSTAIVWHNCICAPIRTKATECPSRRCRCRSPARRFRALPLPRSFFRANTPNCHRTVHGPLPYLQVSILIITLSFSVDKSETYHTIFLRSIGPKLILSGR